MTQTLGDFVDISTGYPFRGRIEPSKEGEAFVVQARNIGPDGEIFTNNLVCSELTGKKDPGWLQFNDIIFLAKGTKNTASLVKDLPDNTVCSPHFFRLRVKASKQKSVLAEFICWQLNQEAAQRYFKVSAEGSLQVSIRKTILQDTSIALPDVATQNSLVELHRNVIREKKTYEKLIENRQLEMAAIASVLLKKPMTTDEQND
ncbi:restriction endonuclease subunit S [Marinomonas sp. A79]|uniref:Restriction endonuclease subunit S n=1 Tax=Marinomonas vulgaris TaxID=2823372 RepID=A0ABS5HFG9_9GAMM|nr:restriction endonuclease subunit S [Marinomonas vulgaris]MBR7890152.1 restriction endonuclease subunit S [Marinomonas vulgaris]